MKIWELSLMVIGAGLCAAFTGPTRTASAPIPLDLHIALSGLKEAGLVRAAEETDPVQLQIDNGTAASGDIQQYQNGVGQTDMIDTNSVPANVSSMTTGDGRSITVENGQMVLHRNGVGTITIPAER